MQFVLAVHLVQLIFGKTKRREPVDEVRRKHLGLAVERITGEPDQLLLAEADAAGVIELGAKLSLVDHLGKTHMPAAIDDRKGDALVRVEFPDHLQHQQLVEIGVEQAAHDRVEPPAVIIGSACNVCDCHIGTLSRQKPRNQCLSVAHYVHISVKSVAWPGRRPHSHRSRAVCPGRIAAGGRTQARRADRRSCCP